MNVVLPQPTEEQIGVAGRRHPDGRLPGALPAARPLRRPHRVAALHLGRAVRRGAGLAVVMPAVHRSFYANERTGARYWDFVSEELPQVVAAFFRVSRASARHLRRRPVDGRVRRHQARPQPPRAVRRSRLAVRRPRPRRPHLEGTASGTDRAVRAGLRRRSSRRSTDLLALLEQADPSTLPRLHVSAGTEDSPALVEGNRRFVAELTKAGVDVTSDFRPGRARLAAVGRPAPRGHRLDAAPRHGVRRGHHAGTALQ